MRRGLHHIKRRLRPRARNPEHGLPGLPPLPGFDLPSPPAPPQPPRPVRVGLIIVSLAVLASLGLVLLFGIKIRFVFSDELELAIAPLDVNVQAANNESVPIHFAITNRNFAQCKSRCAFSLMDVGTNTTLHRTESIVPHGRTVRQDYAIPPAGRGRGVVLYSFETECRNLNSVVCPTTGTVRHRSALIRVNYTYPAEEAALKARLERRLRDDLASLAEAATLSARAAAVRANLAPSMERTDLDQAGAALAVRLGDARRQADAALRLWAAEDYAAAAALPRLEADLLQDAAALYARSQTLLAAHNRNRALLSAFDVLKVPLAASSQTLVAEPNPTGAARLARLANLTGALASLPAALSGTQAYSEQAVLATLVQNADALKAFLADERARAHQGAFLLAWLSLQAKLTPGIGCPALRQLAENLEASNAAAHHLRQSQYNWTFGDVAAESGLRAAADMRAHAALRMLAADNTSPHAARAASDLAAAAPVTLPNATNLSAEELFALAPVNFTALGAHLADACRQGNVSLNASLDDFLAANLSLDPVFPGLSPPDEAPAAMADPPPRCCAFGECRACCQGWCAPAPVLFVHGHIVNDANPPEHSMTSFTKLQRRMQADGFINAGLLDVSNQSITAGDWGGLPWPLTARSSYYYIPHIRLGQYMVSAQKSERIENYALRLKEVVDLLRLRTGAPNITIVAHSMGGLVARQYLALFGWGDVDRVILINTPNHGISGAVKRLCPVLGAAKECDDMAQGSIFLSRLNARPPPADASLHVIHTTGCSMDGEPGDGIVTERSARLEGATNYQLNGTCSILGSNLHVDKLDPDLHPDTYRLLLRILGASSEPGSPTARVK